jgi:peptidyl-prolyl cis-trans isomerase D
MTMLDRMRRHKAWLNWTLVLVVAAFIWFYVPDFFDRGQAGTLNEVVATVGNEEITAGAFRTAYQMQLQAYQRAYGGNINEQLMRQLGIDQQILQQMIDERAAVAEAERLGLAVSDQEVAGRIFAMPAFQQNGQFAGEQVYEQVLRMQRPPLTKAEFEENLRRALLVDKLRSAVTDWIALSDADVDREYVRRNEKVKVELVTFSADTVRDQVTVADADLAPYFDAHKEQYRVGEKRKIRYLLVDADALKSKVVVAPGDVERSYRENIQQYSTPEQVRASHILLKTEGKDEAAVKAQAEEILKQVKAGGDFAALATKYSEDEASAKQGGDLDYFGRGRMVKEFEEKAFALEPGQVSDLVKTPFGFHIIKVVDKKPAATKAFAEVQQQIADQLAYERAQERASTIGSAIEKAVSSPADLDKAAQQHGLKVEESGFFEKDEPIMNLGPAPEITERAFTVQEGTVAGPIRSGRGPVFFTVVGKQESRLPALADVKDRVRDDLVRERARELSKTKAASLAPQFKANFAAAAKTAKLDPQTTELVARGTTWPGFGANAALDAAVFSLPKGGVSDPIPTENGTVIARVVEKQEVKPEDVADGRDTLRTEILNERRSRFFSAYMVKARDHIKTSINQESLKRVVS